MTDAAAGSAPRVLFYVQHLLGIGHLARASRIARALVADGFSLTMVTGGLKVTGFPGPGLHHVALPPIATGDAGFSGLVDEAGRPIDDAFMAHRRDLLLAAYRDLQPDAVIIEAFPFGRRQVRFELLPLIDAIEASPRKPLLVTSLRDILQERAKPGRDEETVALVKAHFDRVLVHGDPAFVRLEDTFPLASALVDRISYTGLVAAAPAAPSAERFDIVVSAGGGAVGKALITAALDAATLLGQEGSEKRTWCLITGPNLPQAEFDALAARSAANISVFRFRTDFPGLLAGADLSISQAGYNTVCDVLQAGCRSILVPFSTGGETEQSTRAARLESLGLAQSIAESYLTGASLARAVALSLGRPRPDRSAIPPLDGARRTADILRGLLAKHRQPHSF